MTELEFLERFRRDHLVYEKLGKYLQTTITRAAKKGGVPSGWFVIKPSYRVKDEKSIIEKAFYRNKNYADPYGDITAKVGLPFVLLTTDQVNALGAIVEGISSLNCRKDRDYEIEQDANPTTFVYQSMHYVVALKRRVKFEETYIPTGIFCEIQIRTLLQHAYSELTHDTIYKPKTIAEPKTHRLVARSMALIETTDSIFSEVGRQVLAGRGRNEVICSSIISQYGKKLVFEVEEKMNNLVLDAYSEYLPGIDELDKFIQKKRYIIESIRNRAVDKLLYKQPSVVYLYYIVSQFQTIALKLWPFTQQEIVPIYSDLGICLPTL